ncbi:hypothetical protein [Corynebacterium pseudopelargi]
MAAVMLQAFGWKEKFLGQGLGKNMGAWNLNATLGVILK